MTQMEALELALRLAIVAPDQESADKVILLAEEIAAGLDQEEVNAVQEEIECQIFQENHRATRKRGISRLQDICWALGRESEYKGAGWE